MEVTFDATHIGGEIQVDATSRSGERCVWMCDDGRGSRGGGWSGRGSAKLIRCPTARASVHQVSSMVNAASLCSLSLPLLRPLLSRRVRSHTIRVKQVRFLQPPFNFVPTTYHQAATCFQFRVTLLKVSLWAVHRGVAPYAMPAWELGCQRVLLRHSSPKSHPWLAGEHFTCPCYIQVTVYPN